MVDGLFQEQIPDLVNLVGTDNSPLFLRHVVLVLLQLLPLFLSLRLLPLLDLLLAAFDEVVLPPFPKSKLKSRSRSE